MTLSARPILKGQRGVKEYYILLTSDFLQRKDIDATTKLILGYIATRLNIPEIEWTISKSDLARQLGISKQTATRKLEPLIKKGILSLAHIIDINGGGKLEQYKINRQAFTNHFEPQPSSNMGLPSSKMEQASSKMEPISKSTEIRKNKESTLSTSGFEKEINKWATLKKYSQGSKEYWDEYKRIQKEADNEWRPIHRK
jgi:predicted transcriptional regulator